VLVSTPRRELHDHLALKVTEPPAAVYDHETGGVGREGRAGGVLLVAAAEVSRGAHLPLIVGHDLAAAGRVPVCLLPAVLRARELVPRILRSLIPRGRACPWRSPPPRPPVPSSGFGCLPPQDEDKHDDEQMFH
jgi:hypothetical protein